jgi:hypothetical protein
MTQDDIIRMAEEARVHFENFGDRYIERLEKFAEIVAAAEREECAKLCEAYSTVEGIAQQCAEAIRARGKK